jgi:hypothetical protein
VFVSFCLLVFAVLPTWCWPLPIQHFCICFHLTPQGPESEAKSWNGFAHRLLHYGDNGYGFRSGHRPCMTCLSSQSRFCSHLFWIVLIYKWSRGMESPAEPCKGSPCQLCLLDYLGAITLSTVDSSCSQPLPWCVSVLHESGYVTFSLLSFPVIGMFVTERVH